MADSLRDTIRKAIARHGLEAPIGVQDGLAERIEAAVAPMLDSEFILALEGEREDMERLAFQAGEERREALENAEQAADEIGRLREAVNDAVAALAELEAEVRRLVTEVDLPDDYGGARYFYVGEAARKQADYPRIAALLQEAGRADG